MALCWGADQAAPSAALANAKAAAVNAGCM